MHGTGGERAKARRSRVTQRGHHGQDRRLRLDKKLASELRGLGDGGHALDEAVKRASVASVRVSDRRPGGITFEHRFCVTVRGSTVPTRSREVGEVSLA